MFSHLISSVVFGIIDSHCSYAEQARKGCSDLMFLELLFWKNTREAESLRNNYQWKARSVYSHAG